MRPTLDQPITFPRGPQWHNRFALAPLTNHQSNADGTLGDDELTFLAKRADGGFGLVMTCAAHVQKGGQGFPGQLGVWSDDHLPGLTRLAAAIRAGGSVSSVQLQHSGERSSAALTGEDVVAPFDRPDRGVRALTTAEVEQLVADFIAAAVRCETAGFDGVELHGAHGYMLCEFLHEERNRRTDRYGGSYENRTRIYHEVIDGIRAATGPQFQLGVRVSPEKYGYGFGDALRFAGELLGGGKLDYLDMSLWDSFKEPDEEPFHGKRLIDWFGQLPRGETRLGVAGKIFSTAEAVDCLSSGADFVFVGRGAILHHDFPRRALADPAFVSATFPVTSAYLASEGVGAAFVNYLATGWKNYVAD
ncbi:NADH:flavin oxidoreductase [Novosphingobium lentum]|uniref:NADH:flavin oxidoreductase n=1 Tax=Novosphingobium lentum TaxID=145287 RepID=UPI00082CCDE3|nr:NADH:flavin oxidoreductase [Novosphingobium lentum]